MCLSAKFKSLLYISQSVFDVLGQFWAATGLCLREHYSHNFFLEILPGALNFPKFVMRGGGPGGLLNRP